MAVTLIEQPAETVAAANCPKYSLLLDSAGVDPIVNSIGYELYVGGEKLAGLEEIGYTGAAEDFNASEILKAQVRATLLDYNATAPTTDNAAVKQFYLRYGQIQFNKDTCDRSTSLGNQSATRYAVSAVFPWYLDESVIDAGAPVVLSERPARVQIYTGQRDWLHVWRKSGSIAVRFKGYDSNGTLVQQVTRTASLNRQVRIFPIGPGNGFFSPMLSSVSYYDIEVHDSAPGDPDINALGQEDFAIQPIAEGGEVGLNAIVWACRFSLASCANQSAPNDEIYFEEPIGGYSGIKFLEVQARSSTSSQRYLKGVPCGITSPGRGLDYGVTRYGVESYEGWLMRTEIPYEDGIERWISAFFSAKNHFMKFKLPAGGFTYAKVNLVDGTYNILNNRETIVVEAIFETHISRI
ncbi:hypothetical protein KC887_00640 [Candidatus Kaiserbacteria bacterium]|nr:hypothetical protein [Candidatus Kaiserbacteria bacterium]